jgi:hypothetical protein
MNSIHIVGSIIGCSNFSEGNVDYQCKYEIQTNATKPSAEERMTKKSHLHQHPLWILQNGETNGTTQLHESTINSDRGIWNHPIDVQFLSTGIKGWPTLVFEVWNQNSWGKRSFAGFGSHRPFPTSGTNNSDMKEVDVIIWRPQDQSLWERIRCSIMGRPRKRYQDSLRTMSNVESVGIIHLSIQVLVSRI